VGHVTGHPERVDGRRELEIAFEHVAGLAQRTAERGHMVPVPAVPVPQVAMENGRVIKPILRMTDDEKDCA
jgi:hypothetical protein